MDFYRESLDRLVSTFKTDLVIGLSQREAARRLRQTGPNALPGRPQERLFLLFLKQLNNPFSYLLIIAAVLKYLVEGYRDAIIIGIIIVANALVSAVQEGRASQTLAKLRSFLKTDCLVVRDGKMVLIDQALLVPGDLVVLHEGMRVPADARLFEGHMLRVDEAVLTGESTPVTKVVTDLSGSNLPLTDQINMVFAGTTILGGHAHALIVATGKRAYIGQLSEEIETIEVDMPLKRDLARLSYFLLRAVVGIVTIFFVVGLIRGKAPAELVFTMISLLVSIVPEGIPIVSTILMARNAYKMAKSHVLVKRLQAIDGLGRLQVLVIDKTGTLTKNEQMVSIVGIEERVYTVTGSGYNRIGKIFGPDSVSVEIAPETPLWYSGLAAGLLDDAELTADDKTGTIRVRGEPIQAALGIYAKKMGFDPVHEQKIHPKIAEIPFSSDTPLQKALFELDGQKKLFVVMGGPERVAQYCAMAEPILLNQMLEGGLRVIAIGYGVTEQSALNEIDPQSIEHVCLFGLNDAIRPDAAESIRAVQELGVRVLVATGDHLQTAIYTARATGIYQGVLSVREGSAIGDGGESLEGITVLARITPQKKLQLIRQFKKAGQLVGMTGDGVNDVPALVAADVGIAMGMSGTDVAKEAASIVLLDDSLASIAEGIMLGRHAFLTMRHVLIFVLATSASEILAFAVALVLNVPLPLLATQILWVHMLTDGLLTIALGMEPVDKRVAKLPLEPQTRLLDKRMTRVFLLTSVPVAVATLGLFMYYLPSGIATARTVALTVLAMGQWWNAWNMRSETESVFAQNLFANRWLFVSTILVIGAQIGALYVPVLQKVLYTVPLSVYDFGLCLGISSLVLWTEEARKFICRRASS